VEVGAVVQEDVGAPMEAEEEEEEVVQRSV